MKPSIRRIARLNLALGGVLVLVGALTQPREIALGVAVGVALTCANFFVLGKLVRRWTAEAARGGTGGNSAFLMLPKMVLLMGAVAASLIFLPIDPLAFTAGYSTFIVSIIIDSIYSALRPEPDGPGDATEHNHG